MPVVAAVARAVVSAPKEKLAKSKSYTVTEELYDVWRIVDRRGDLYQVRWLTKCYEDF